MSLPNWINKNESTKKKSIKQEKKFAKRIGAKRRAQSGASDFWKGDMSKGNYLIEHKSVITQKQIVVKEKMLKKIFIEAHKENKSPIFALEFKNYILIGKVIKK